MCRRVENKNEFSMARMAVFSLMATRNSAFYAPERWQFSTLVHPLEAPVGLVYIEIKIEKPSQRQKG